MKEFITKYKLYLIMGILGVFIIGGFIFFSTKEEVGTNSIIEEKEIVLEKSEEKEEEKDKKEEVIFYVDIKGEVKKPGVYKVKENTRVNDIISLAGGLTKNANTRSINLSKRVNDEMVIIVHSKSEITDFTKTKEKEKSIALNCTKESYDLVNEACINEVKEETVTNSNLISLNAATKEELMTLSGIGEKKAIDIISYRELNNGFKTIEEIMNISGIGETLFAQIKDYITV